MLLCHAFEQTNTLFKVSKQNYKKMLTNLRKHITLCNQNITKNITTSKLLPKAKNIESDTAF